MVDFFKDAYTGSVDTVAGFALVASAQTCFVWQHVQVFALDINVNVHSSMSFVSGRRFVVLLLVIYSRVLRTILEQARPSTRSFPMHHCVNQV